MNTKRELAALPIAGKPNNYMVISLYYDIGGANYFSGTTNRRGYYLSATPEERTENMKVYGMFSGIKKLILEANRFSQKQLDSLTVNQSDIDELVNYVCPKEKIEIEKAVR